MDVTSLKKYMHKNDKIEHVLEKLGCHNIKHNENKGYYSAAMPDGDNPSGVIIYDNEYLGFVSYSRNIGFDESQDIVNLVQIANKCGFVDAIKWLHSAIGIEYSPYKKEKVKKIDPLEIFRRIRSRRYRVDVNEIHAIDEEAINDYEPLLHIDWYRDGIMHWTREKFGLAYSYKHRRVVIPHRYWADGRLLGFNMRTTIENYDELGIKKYYLSEGMNKSTNLYGLWENYDSIQEAGYVVVYEGERSVLKRDSLGDATGVALSGKTMSEEQRRILIGLDVEIVIALDFDVDINDIRSICEKLYRARKVSYIRDRHGILCTKGWAKEKDSPADVINPQEIRDKNKETGERRSLFKDYLLKYRTIYDEHEHDEYLKALNNK